MRGVRPAPEAAPAPALTEAASAAGSRTFVLVGLTLAPAVAVVLAVASGGVVPEGSILDTGRLTRWGLPAVRVVRDVTAALAIGFLVVSATLLPGRSPQASTLGPVRRRAARLGALAASGWVGSQAVLLVLTFFEVAGPSVFQGGVAAQLSRFLRELDLGKALVVSCVLAAVAALVSAVATRVTAVGVAAVLAAAGLLPLALTGHAASAANHDVAVDALGGHLLGVSVWLGGLAAVAVLRPLLGASFAVVIARYSRLAGWCFVLVGVSGIVSATIRVESPAGLDTSYGMLLLAKVVALALLGAAGWWHRRRLLPLLEGNARTRGFLRLVAGELALMGLAVALAAALSRTPPPSNQGSERVTAVEALLGYPPPPPLTGNAWLTEWRVDPLWLPLGLAALLWYVGAVIRLRRGGDRWPLGRSAGWVLGCLMLIAATNGSPGVYGSVLFSMHMVQHMTVAMAVPVLLTFGAPITLALRTLRRRTDGSWGPREWLLRVVRSRLLHLLGHPLVASALFIASLVVFYYSPLFELSLRTHTGHTLMIIHFIVSGYLFANVICGIDPGPARPPYPFRMVLLMAVFAFHAFFAISMMSSPVLAPAWFQGLERDWGPSPQQDQYRGGAISWALGDYPIAILALAMVVGWVKSDAREGRRYDRQAARDGDRALASYNTYLQQLHRGSPRSLSAAEAAQGSVPQMTTRDLSPGDGPEG